MTIRHYVRNFFVNARETAKATGFDDFLRHLKSPPEFRLEPLMPRELPRPKEVILPSGATAGGKRQFAVSGPIR